MTIFRHRKDYINNKKGAVMSFGGHALDMMKRTQENRARLKESRESSKDIRKRYSKNNSRGLEPNMTLEEYEEVRRQSKEREAKDKRFYFWAYIIFAMIGFGLTLLLAFLT